MDGSVEARLTLRRRRLNKGEQSHETTAHLHGRHHGRRSHQPHDRVQNLQNRRRLRPEERRGEGRVTLVEGGSRVIERDIGLKVLVEGLDALLEDNGPANAAEGVVEDEIRRLDHGGRDPMTTMVGDCTVNGRR